MSGATATWNSWRGWDLCIEPDLTGANLSEAELSEADLTEANLAGADLSGVDLAQAILVGAILTGADLSTASLTQQVLEPATVDENTCLPLDLQPEHDSSPVRGCTARRTEAMRNLQEWRLEKH